MSVENNKENVRNAMAYIPVASFVLYLIDEKKDARYSRNLKYSMIICITWIILGAIVTWRLKGLVSFAYFGFSAYLAYMAYNGDDVRIKIIDEFINKK